MFDSLFRERGLTLDRLRVLLEVHDAGSIVRAAGRDSVRQSLYSRQLRELGEYFGCEMVERRGKVVKLTPEGVFLVAPLREFLRTVEDFRSETKREKVSFCLGAGDSLVQWLLIPRLGNLRTSEPTLRYITHNLRTDEIVQQLLDSRLDFGLVRRNAVVPSLKSAPLGRLRYTLVVPTQLLKRGVQLTLEQALAILPVAAQETAGEFSGRFRSVSADKRISFQPTLGCQSFPQVFAAIKSGKFAGIIPDLPGETFPAAAFIRLRSPFLAPLERDIVLAWNPNRIALRPSARRLLALLQAELRF